VVRNERRRKGEIRKGKWVNPISSSDGLSSIGGESLVFKRKKKSEKGRGGQVPLMTSMSRLKRGEIKPLQTKKGKKKQKERLNYESFDLPE